MEGKADQGGSQGLKILDNLRKHLFDITDSTRWTALKNLSQIKSILHICMSNAMFKYVEEVELAFFLRSDEFVTAPCCLLQLGYI